jgi:thiamine biosynthesis lipoprotein
MLMGTVITMDVRAAGLIRESVLDEAFGFLHDVDERFSPYLASSEISRLAAGEIGEDACSADVRWVLGLCDDLTRTSHGFFDARRHRADGRLDPSGVAKGWSIEQVAWILERAGADTFAINAGGDVIVRGEPEAGRFWRIGIQHPQAAARIAAVLELPSGAVATSGTYERGDHIRDPHTGLAPRGLVSITVVGPSLTYADAYATAAYAMGVDGIDWVASHPGYGAFAITADDRAIATPTIERLIA